LSKVLEVDAIEVKDGLESITAVRFLQLSNRRHAFNDSGAKSKSGHCLAFLSRGSGGGK
jgi:hypothetical protein